MNGYRHMNAAEREKMSALDRFSKWLQLKIYQLEVTLSVYMFTPVEKFIFYSVLFLLTSLTFIATVLYLPQHLRFIINRAWFYMHGDGHDLVDVAKQSASLAGTKLQTAAEGIAKATARVLREL
ncbi:hypothetical protein QBC46DRAFT_337870 [Diplogelasinospora grovesii]|uniref:Uncharacterized protein n=1 Tax=Diplogelasinospora grovesii TaxID=303347 RepID=A0AAN6NE89_9PEZI|nr:hypothetical protein QBC46DRAFT_337870 [Diplogelasinospora grovesii]